MEKCGINVNLNEKFVRNRNKVINLTKICKHTMLSSNKYKKVIR